MSNEKSPVIISASISGAIHLQLRYLLVLIPDQTNVTRLVVTGLSYFRF